MGDNGNNGSKVIGKRKFVFSLLCLLVLVVLVLAGPIKGPEFVDALGYLIVGFLGANALEHGALMLKKG